MGLVFGSTQWDNGSDAIDGEIIADNTIDEDSVDWGTGAGQVDLSDIPGTSLSVVTTTDGTETATMYGQKYIADHATPANDTTYTLPAVANGLHGCFYDYGGGAGKIILDPGTSDHIVLNGTAASDNENIESPGADGDYLCIFSDGTDWYSMERSGTWVEATP
jgi:hypothetical protein